MKTYRSFLGRLVLVTANGVVSNVEGMITSRCLGIVTALDDEGVSLASHHVNLRYEQAVYVPGNSPAHVTCFVEGPRTLNV